jgi:16S rRNA (guanine(966)-N(2))-methyltransferase RsmD
MRVIAGTARGTRLESPSGNDVRPTLDRVRESVFNILGDSVQDVAFLDLFAGTGANGIEALSRGAKLAVFADRVTDHLALIQRNLTKTKLADYARTARCTLPDQLSAIGGSYEIVYADPPHVFKDYQTLIDALGNADLIADSGRLILETRADVTFDEEIGGMVPLDSRTWGDTRITIFT